MEDSIPKFNIKITDDYLRDGTQELISKIRPDWPANKLHYKIFTGGITNRLIGVYKDNRNKHDMILIRIYGENTDLFIDRNIECRNMRIMYKHGLSAPIYGTFLNGICYGYSPGTVLDEKMVRDDNISTLIAEQMAQMHTLKPLITNSTGQINQYIQGPQACFFQGLKKFVALIDIALPMKLLTNKKLKNFCDISKLRFEVNFLEQVLTNLNSPIVFCHNDLLLKNIIFDEKGNNVTFIDFEYSDYNYQAYDIANHFCEFCGLDSFDSSLYPDKEFQLRWLRVYLQKWYSLMKQEDDESLLKGTVNIEQDVELLYDAVNKFSLGPHLYWGMWALVQASNSSIDFDYVSFACNRFEEYYKRKNMLFQNNE